jgi:hypothetical protein
MSFQMVNCTLRARTRVDFDGKTFTVQQPEARPFTRINYREPWKLELRVVENGCIRLLKPQAYSEFAAIIKPNIASAWGNR